MNRNPVFEKEIKRNTRSIRISWIVFGCNLLLGGIALICFFGESSVLGYMTPTSYTIPMRCYMLMAYLLFFLLLMAVPVIAGASISLEREKRTLDLLLTTHLNPWRIITGKLEASLSIIFVIAFSALPALSLIMVFGGVGLADLLILVLILLVSGVFIGSIGICCSVFFRKTTVATLMSYVIVLLFVVGTIGVVGLDYYLQVLRGQGTGLIENPDVGAAIYLFLMNPFLTFFGLLSQQIGSGRELILLCNLFGDYEGDWLVQNMIPVSVAVQLLLSVIFLVLAGKKLNPMKK